MSWRERQALAGPRRRWFFASVVPEIVKGDDGKIKFVWPKRGVTYVKYLNRRAERASRADLREFSIVCSA